MSPKVTVRFTGQLRTLARRGNLELSLEEGATLEDAIAAAGGSTAPFFANQVVEPLLEGEQSVPLLLWNRKLCSRDDLDRDLGDGDIVAFVQPMDGG
jgi:molybdopterin converting factor small subunit